MGLPWSVSMASLRQQSPALLSRADYASRPLHLEGGRLAEGLLWDPDLSGQLGMCDVLGLQQRRWLQSIMRTSQADVMLGETRSGGRRHGQWQWGSFGQYNTMCKCVALHRPWLSLTMPHSFSLTPCPHPHSASPLALTHHASPPCRSAVGFRAPVQPRRGQQPRQ